MNSVEITDLLIKYGQFNLNVPCLEIAEGQVLHIFGANASGKTTLLEAIFGLRTLDDGQITIFGKESDLRASDRIVDLAYLSDDGFELFEELTPLEYWTLYSKIVQCPLDSHSVTCLAQDLGLSDIGIPIHRLSKGGRRKTQLVSAFMRQPRLYLLDEPQAGLDPVSVLKFDELLFHYARSGMITTVIAGHDLTLPDRLPGRCIILSNGRIVFDQDSNDNPTFSHVLRNSLLEIVN